MLLLADRNERGFINILENLNHMAEQGETPEVQDAKTIYELGVHMVPTLGEEKIATQFADLKKLIEKHHGSCFAEGSPKRMQLAYTMVKRENNKNTKYDTSYFGWIKFDALGSDAKTLKADIDALPGVLRYIVVKTTRESTYLQPRQVSYSRREKPLRADPATEGPKQEVSEEQLDKRIEELVSEGQGEKND